MIQHEERILSIAHETLEREIAALRLLQTRLDDSFSSAVEALHACSGRVILTGMGKSGLVARKIAATMTSTGTPALFLHPAEAMHGDMGIIQRGDVVVVLSYSGRTDETLVVAEYAHRNGNLVVAMTGCKESPIASIADIHLDVSVESEDCIIEIVPTSSTTAQIALGDALATALMHKRGFNAEAFAHLHPGGYIERRLMLDDGETTRGETTRGETTK